MLVNRSTMSASRVTIWGKLLQHPAGAQHPGVVHDRLETQHVLAFGVTLQRQQPEVDFEQGQVPPSSLDHDRLTRRQIHAVPAWSGSHAEQGPQPGHVEPDPGAVHDGVERALHHRPGLCFPAFPETSEPGLIL
jgi:hypothetical protein